METMILQIFQHEVKRQCKFASIAFKDMKHALDTHDMDRIWYCVQAFLIAAGNISKLLWPSAPLLPERGDELRTSFAISDESPLEPRKFRNHFEHFDERLEKWAASSKRNNFVDSNVISQGAIKGVNLEDCLRNLDSTNFAVTFRGDVYYLLPVYKAIEELWRKAETQKLHFE